MQMPNQTRQFTRDGDFINRSEVRRKVDTPYGSLRKAALERDNMVGQNKSIETELVAGMKKRLILPWERNPAVGKG
jgi:hypothetical protein